MLDRLRQSVRVSPEIHVHGDHVAVHVHALDPVVGEQTSGQLVDRPVVFHTRSGVVPLVAHAGDRAVDLEPHDTRIGRGLHDDGDRLTHGTGCYRLHPPGLATTGGQLLRDIERSPRRAKPASAAAANETIHSRVCTTLNPNDQSPNRIPVPRTDQ